MKNRLFHGLKRLARVLVALLAVYLLLALILTLIHPRFFYHLLYFGDHVSGAVRLVVDGETVPLDAEDFQNLTNEGMLGRRLRVRPRADGSARIAWRAGDYGSYRFSLRSGALEKPLELRVYHTTTGTSAASSRRSPRAWGKGPGNSSTL